MLSLPPLPFSPALPKTGNQIVGSLDADGDGVVT
jgi:hypothetical protein